MVGMEPERNLDPWIMLASSYPNDGQVTADGDDTSYVPETVDRGDNDQPGVSSCTKDQTPVGKLAAKDPSAEGSILRRFGLDFKFSIIRRGTGRRSVKIHRGPDLAHVMQWHWDPKAE